MAQPGSYPELQRTWDNQKRVLGKDEIEGSNPSGGLSIYSFAMKEVEDVFAELNRERLEGIVQKHGEIFTQYAFPPEMPKDYRAFMKQAAQYCNHHFCSSFRPAAPLERALFDAFAQGVLEQAYGRYGMSGSYLAYEYVRQQEKKIESVFSSLAQYFLDLDLSQAVQRVVSKNIPFEKLYGAITYCAREHQQFFPPEFRGVPPIFFMKEPDKFFAPIIFAKNGAAMPKVNDLIETGGADG